MVPSAMARPVMSNNVRGLTPDDVASPNGTTDGYLKSSRLAPVARPGTEDRATSISLTQSIGNGAKAWNSDSNIWASDLRSVTRDSSRTRDASAFLPSSKDVIEGKTGSSSLMPSSETDGWSRRTPWESTTSSGPHMRSSGVSPVRRGSSQLNPGQSLLDNSQHSSQYYSASRAANAVGTKPTNGIFDSTGLGGARHSEGGLNGFGHYSRSSDESTRAHDAIGWPDAGSVHSPTDDRRSISNSEYFGASSAGASRSGSLPPSRQGNEPLQFSQVSDGFSRFGQNPSAARGHTSSFSQHSNGRFPLDRQNSQHSDILPNMLGRMSLENNGDQGMHQHRSSTGINGNSFQPTQQDSTYLRNSHDLSNTYDEGGANGAGSFTPEGYPSFHDPFHRHRLSERGALTPGTTDFRHSPYYSTGGTPPVYEGMFPSRTETSRAFPNAHPIILDRKLRGLQQEQQQPLMHHAPYQPSLMGPYRGNYNYASTYPMANTLQMNGISSSLGLPQSIPGLPQSSMYPMIEPPRGPREHESLSMQSPLLVEFKASSKGNRRWELKDIFGHLVEFSGDQYGSRFIQQKLETANSDEKQLVFKEIMPDVMQLMQDVFGNYVIQKFFEHGDQSQKKVLASRMKGQVMNLSLQMYGCRVVQKALEHVLTDQQAELVKELEPNVMRCVKDQNGNHVVQKAIERVPGQHIQFILDSFSAKVGELAIHAYGCRVIQRVLEHCQEPAKRSVLAELHACGSTLISDQYGNYVTQHIIEHGYPEDRARVIGLVKMNLLAFSKHKFASNVVEKCLIFGTPEQKREILQEIISKNDRESSLSQLIKDGYGNYVVQKFLDTLEGDDYAAFVEALQPEMIKARRTVTGKQIAAVEKKMHKFDRNDSPSTSYGSTPPSATTSSASPTTRTLIPPQIALPSASESAQASTPDVQTPRAMPSPVALPIIGLVSRPHQS